MKPVTQPDREFEQREFPRLMDTLIRVALIVGLAVLCFRVLSPFLNLIVWSIILAVTLYPLHQMLARRVGGRQKLSLVLFVITGIALIVFPTWLLMTSFAGSIQRFIG